MPSRRARTSNGVRRTRLTGYHTKCLPMCTGAKSQEPTKTGKASDVDVHDERDGTRTPEEDDDAGRHLRMTTRPRPITTCLAIAGISRHVKQNRKRSEAGTRTENENKGE